MCIPSYRAMKIFLVVQFLNTTKTIKEYNFSKKSIKKKNLYFNESNAHAEKKNLRN